MSLQFCQASCQNETSSSGALVFRQSRVPAEPRAIDLPSAIEALQLRSATTPMMKSTSSNTGARV